MKVSYQLTQPILIKTLYSKKEIGNRDARTGRTKVTM